MREAGERRGERKGDALPTQWVRRTRGLRSSPEGPQACEPFIIPCLRRPRRILWQNLTADPFSRSSSKKHALIFLGRHAGRNRQDKDASAGWLAFEFQMCTQMIGQLFADGQADATAAVLA